MATSINTALPALVATFDEAMTLASKLSADDLGRMFITTTGQQVLVHKAPRKGRKASR